MEAGGQRFEPVIRERVIIKSPVLLSGKEARCEWQCRFESGTGKSLLMRVSGVIIRDDKRY